MNKRLQIGGKGIPVAITLIAFLGWAKVSSSEWLPFMPASHDRTEVWWQDGFPGLVDGAPWRQCLLTGRFGMVLDTEKLKIPHLGEVSEKGVLTFLPVGEKWKLQNLDLQSEERVQKVSRNRVVAEPVASPENDPNRNESSLEAP